MSGKFPANAVRTMFRIPKSADIKLWPNCPASCFLKLFTSTTYFWLFVSVKSASLSNRSKRSAIDSCSKNQYCKPLILCYVYQSRCTSFSADLLKLVSSLSNNIFFLKTTFAVIFVVRVIYNISPIFKSASVNLNVLRGLHVAFFERFYALFVLCNVTF